ncbi:MAG TPA: MopE-related protein, partial [Polyangiales bacterium]
MTTPRSVRPWLVVPLLTAIACGADRREDAPETTTDMPPATAEDASDAATPMAFDAAPALDARSTAPETSLPRIDCLSPDSGIACDDGVYCNGSERCEPSAPNADVRGCVSTGPVVCAAGQTCSERMHACSVCSDSALDDGDGDGHEAASCGGDDCRDDDPTAYPGAAEACNGRDDDCDGTIDGTVASAACMMAAPAMSTSSCVSGGCQINCTDPDADLVAGACVKHDDCAGVTACGPGTCVDGVRAYTCTCPSGYAGTTSCADIDECASASSHDCDTSPAACVNDPGTYHCACPDSHRGDGKGAHGCMRKAIAVTAGSGNSCALLRGGLVKCWGSNQFGKLGISGDALGASAGQMGDALPSVALRTAATSIAAGSDLTCAVLADGAAKCWGYNKYGACGGPGPDGLGMFDAPLPMGRKAASVASGSGYGFARLDDGTIGHWGAAFAYYALAPNARVKAFDRSPVYDRYHVCALMESGVVSCWPGYDYYGDTEGYGTLGPNFNPALPPESRPVIALGGGHLARQIATGNQFSCALLDNDTVKCWGRNDYGQLGVGDTVHRGTTVAQMGDALPTVELGAPAKAVASGAEHSCALLSSG